MLFLAQNKREERHITRIGLIELLEFTLWGGKKKPPPNWNRTESTQNLISSQRDSESPFLLSLNLRCFYPSPSDILFFFTRNQQFSYPIGVHDTHWTSSAISIEVAFPFSTHHWLLPTSHARKIPTEQEIWKMPADIKSGDFEFPRREKKIRTKLQVSKSLPTHNGRFRACLAEQWILPKGWKSAVP